MSLIIRYAKMAILFITISWTAGCIKEDNADCPRRLYVCLIPENPKHDLRELFRAADLYFYDETGQLSIRLSYGRDGLRKDGKTILTEGIPQGRYTLVCLINDVDHYHTVNEKYYEYLQTYLTNEVSRERLVDFFSGVTQVNVTGGQSAQEANVDIFKHNNDIRLDVLFEGSGITEGSVLESYVEGCNGVYDYEDGTSPESGYRKYLPYRVTDTGNKTTFDFSVMRLWKDSDLTLCLQQVDVNHEVTGAVELGITEELVKVVDDRGEFLYDTDKKLSFNDEFHILIKVRSDLTIVELVINDWFVIGGGVDV